MSLAPFTAIEVAKHGGDLIIEDDYAPSTLMELLSIAVGRGAKVTIRADNHAPATIQKILETYGRNITFVI